MENEDAPSQAPSSEPSSSVEDLSHLERLSPAEEARVSAALQLSKEQEQEPESRVLIAGDSELESLKRELLQLLDERELRASTPKRSEKDKEFFPWVDCDRILAPGSILQLDGVDVRLLHDAPVMAPRLIDEQEFVEHLDSNSENFRVNTPNLRQRYNRAGVSLGDNEEHPDVRLERAIAAAEERIAILTDPLGAE